MNLAKFQNKVNTQKAVAFLYTNDLERKLNLIISNSIKKNKILGKNLIKEVTDLYTENYKILLKEIKEETNKWRGIPCSWIERLKINILSLCVLDLPYDPEILLLGMYS